MTLAFVSTMILVFPLGIFGLLALLPFGLYAFCLRCPQCHDHTINSNTLYLFFPFRCRKCGYKYVPRTEPIKVSWAMAEYMRGGDIRARNQELYLSIEAPYKEELAKSHGFHRFLLRYKLIRKFHKERRKIVEIIPDDFP
jgi:hypothetical protein